MKILHLPAALLVCAALSPAPAPAAEAKKKPAAPPSQEEAMKAWTAFATPGDAHKKLDAMVGSWTAHTKMWMAPGAPPTESDGTSEMAWVMGGRYVEQKFHGTMMGQPFEGEGWTGYDNYKKKYVGAWIDNSGTGIMTMSGTFDAAGKVLTTTGTIDDVVMKRPAKSKSVSTMSDADHMHWEMWGPDPSGKSYKMLEIDYTRKK